ncbi:MAG TPA: pyruvate, phosphate dikinase [Candidatus Limnocylindrales bacterium]|nr:pyruvate, phosphate dikinase [Candidatus Limnocylindrales bacterium]
MARKKYVYFFGGGKAEGNAKMRNLLGGKGAGLAEMTNLGIPVPPGFTISTEACNEFYKNQKRYPEGMWDEVEENLSRLENLMGAKLGDPDNPLLVSVRSGARASMPGMMDTILNLGLNDQTVQGLIKRTGNERFAYDSYRRFITMFSNVVLGIDRDEFEKLLEEKKKEVGVKLDTELTAEDLKDLVKKYKALVKRKTGKDFPQDPKEQLRMAIGAVFNSWNNKRAIEYRRIYGIPEEWGTAANVQAMVFGNMGENSGTGVAFTRDPSTGEKVFYGDYLPNAQGEDVVAGIRTPQKITTLKDSHPEIYRQLEEVYQKLESHYRDMQDIEFTVQDGKLYMLQTRTGKRTALAAVKIAVDMVQEGLISKEEAIMRVEPDQLDQLLHPIFDPKAKVKPIAKGLPASPGAAVGKVVFSADRAKEWADKGEKVILVRPETSPEDIVGMYAAQGILTSRGGVTSHAAVVGRGMGKCCVVGCGAITIDEEAGQFMVDGIVVKEGDYISLNGNTGEVILGQVPLIQASLTGEFKTFMDWVDEIRTLGVRANADTPEDARIARNFGAEGIGLARTEHMFFGEDRIPWVRKMIMAEDDKTRKKSLEKLLPMQREDFIGIFKAMDGLPVTIRLLDPPLHEFLPNRDEILVKLTELRMELKRRLKADRKKQIQAQVEELEKTLKAIDNLREFNPMLGHRGCRLGISFPAISEMQVRAIFEAAVEVKKQGIKVFPEVMIPLTGTVEEMRITREDTVRVAEEVMREAGVRVDYLVGTMIEVPRAALIADKIAQYAEFFSFGTNDLTQMTFGYSRDDVGKFLPYYLEKKILKADPFATIDQEGVGELVKMATQKGRSARPNLKVGVCGEHGGDPASVEFFYQVGLNYVSCSPYRIPVARLAAAQAKLKAEKEIAVSTSV